MASMYLASPQPIMLKIFNYYAFELPIMLNINFISIMPVNF